MSPTTPTLFVLIALVVPLGAGGPSFGADDDPEANYSAAGEQVPVWARGPIRVGIGDRLTVLSGGEWVPMVDRAAKAGFRPDYLEVWLTRGWRSSWIPEHRIRELSDRGITPVFMHYFFGDEISRERILDEREEWHASLRRLGRIAGRAKAPLIVLEPEFNDDPPEGETATVDWPGFAHEVRVALRLIRAEAPDAKIGICAGDFFPDLNLDVLDGVAEELDFLAFQEMRGSTDPVRGREGYLRVGREATRYARYLRTRFQKPILLAYVAVSSHGGWEQKQAKALRDLSQASGALQEQGVFGVIYFQLQDDPEHVGYFGDAERRFGLIGADGRAKPAFYAFRRLIQSQREASRAERRRRSATPAKLR